jgi:hypothetical protein
LIGGRHLKCFSPGFRNYLSPNRTPPFCNRGKIATIP